MCLELFDLLNLRADMGQIYFVKSAVGERIIMLGVMTNERSFLQAAYETITRGLCVS